MDLEKLTNLQKIVLMLQGRTQIIIKSKQEFELFKYAVSELSADYLNQNIKEMSYETLQNCDFVKGKKFKDYTCLLFSVKEYCLAIDTYDSSTQTWEEIKETSIDYFGYEPVTLSVKAEKPSKILITCYGETRLYDYDEAFVFFSHAVRESEGSEQERYRYILDCLENGDTKIDDKYCD